MGDWGLYSALRGTDDWQQKRQDKMMNLMVAEKREQRAQQANAESMQMEQGIQDYMNELQNLDVLTEDQDRVRQVEKDARKKVIAGITKNNGDLKRYMSTGGVSAVNEYKNSVMNSGAVKQAAVNKVNLQNYLTDQSKGNRRANFVNVDIPTTDDQGNPMMDAQGKPIVKSQKMKFEDQMALFKAGKISQLNYSGSENKVNVGIEDFSRVYKNPLDPYQEDNYVSESDIYKKAMSKGASEEYARDISARYGQMYKEGGDAWRWNAKDPEELRLKQEALELRKQSAAAKAKASEGRKLTSTHLLNSVVPAIEALQPGTQLEMSPKEFDFWKSKFGGKTTDDRGLHFNPGTMVSDSHKPENQYDLGKANNVVFNKYVAKQGKEGKTNRFIEATITYPDPTSGWGGIFSVGGDYSDMPLDDVLGYTGVKDADVRHNWKDDGSGNFTGTVLLPIENLIKTPTIIAALNKHTGLNANADFVPGSVTSEDYLKASTDDIKYLMNDLGFTPEELEQALIDYNQGTYK